MLMAEGIHLVPGIKYGADFLAYLNAPTQTHSSFTVNISKEITFRALSGLVRVSSSTRKDAVLYTGDKEVPFAAFSRFSL